MKTIIKLLPLCLFVLAGTSCIKDEITKEYITENNTYIGVQNYVYDFEVRGGIADDIYHWHEDFQNTNPDIERFYYYSVSVDGLTQYAYDFGNFDCYLDKGNFQQPLPITTFRDDGEFSWIENIDFEVSPGVVTVFFTTNDFADVPPESMWFRLVISYDRTQDPDFKENR